MTEKRQGSKALVCGVVTSGSCVVASGSGVVASGSCVVASGSGVVASGSCVVAKDLPAKRQKTIGGSAVHDRTTKRSGKKIRIFA